MDFRGSGLAKCASTLASVETGDQVVGHAHVSRYSGEVVVLDFAFRPCLRQDLRIRDDGLRFSFSANRKELFLLLNSVSNLLLLLNLEYFGHVNHQSLADRPGRAA